jgi:hypothetical protein
MDTINRAAQEFSSGAAMEDQRANDKDGGAQRAAQADSIVQLAVNAPGNSEPAAKTPQQASVSIEELSKWIAAAAAFVYVTGYLITSLSDFRYGYTDLNPLRPRIIAAGSWFSVFMGVPITIIFEARRRFIGLARPDNPDNLNKLLQLFISYAVAAIFVQFISLPVFRFDTSPAPHLYWWVIVDSVLIGISILISTVASFRKSKSKTLDLVNSIAVTGIFAANFVATFQDAFVKRTFTPNAAGFWVILVGVSVGSYMWRREYQFPTHRWRSLLFIYFTLLGAFAEIYYPHILREWGGGSPLQIELTLSKDAPVNAGQRIACSLVDETETGLYVLGIGDKHATFIPRSEVALIYYGEGNESSSLGPGK